MLESCFTLFILALCEQFYFPNQTKLFKDRSRSGISVKKRLKVERGTPLEAAFAKQVLSFYMGGLFICGGCRWNLGELPLPPSHIL